jgi:Tol biopolymer transport system component
MSAHRHHGRLGAIAIGALCIAALAGHAQATRAATATTSRISVSSAGIQGNGQSLTTSPGANVSADGRFVVFRSESSNLVPGDSNGRLDVFLRNRSAGTTQRVSVSSTGRQANGDSFDPSISPDGRYVVYTSSATNLVPGDTNAVKDVFLYDRINGTTTRISVSSAGVQGNGDSYAGQMSADDRVVSFSSAASNLVSGDTNNAYDGFVRLLGSGKTKRVTVSSSGQQGNAESRAGSLSADGRFVVFYSRSSNLVPGDTNGYADVFVRDRVNKTTERVSVASDGTQGCEYENGSSANSEGGSISADGRYVVFDSEAACLTENDDSGDWDVFLHDRVTGVTTLVSATPTGEAGNLYDANSAISGDGRFIVFDSDSFNLAGSTIQERVFLVNRATGALQVVSRTSTGAVASDGNWPTISATGRFVAFWSSSTNVVPTDTNGVTDVFLRDRAVS